MRESNECLSKIIKICARTQTDLCEVKATECFISHLILNSFVWRGKWN